MSQSSKPEINIKSSHLQEGYKGTTKAVLVKVAPAASVVAAPRPAPAANASEE